ncbi:HupE / UreJ protein [Bernardetia litoralis DSM 6794]|uniref:HupE / UreJ protein n=1 Tax=Bernardetia litoralis (strain ATCC 23117 / DSM 6794 / NBRC 15988 / NCIMB 1366 / Fx l1 / Sio-4) TaxID=880071 RepID=I4ANF7_BERLS|nr:HupE/UreJ family protein [Bernardetia litoralis]AFM05492.1 HupE / UreJ protein [Bernardetia litoralis DSM 6794]
MNEFFTFMGMGIEHILQFPDGYDHLLFILALSAIYTFSEWKKVLLLVTAFTIGHSITLLLTISGISPIPSSVIEWLIPLTIIIVCILNFITKIKDENNQNSKKINSSIMVRRYSIALVFGLIHGLGFANYLRQMLPDSLLNPLLGFNVGLEIAQILVVLIGLGIGFVVMKYLDFTKNRWKIILSAIVLVFALHLFVMQTLALFE